MPRTISSNSLTFIDTTDTKKIDVHISSNHPTVQLYDTNLGTYTPNWNPTVIINEVPGEPLVLSATVHADSINVTDLSATTYQWFKDKDFTSSISNSKNLTISTNILNSNTSIVEYTCRATYNNKKYDNKIVFTLVTTGKNGIDGKPGKDGNDGQDGKSVGIKGVAYTDETFVAGAEVTLYSDPEYKNKITTGGDADTVDGYLVDGYLCVYTGENFIWTGKIQGPKGEQGDSSFLFIRYADSINPTEIYTTAGNRKYIGFYRSSTNAVPTDKSATTWGWTKFVGDDAKSISLSATTQVFRVGKDGKVSPSTLTITPQAVNTSITKWEYGRNGGIFSTALPNGVVRGDDNKITITGTSMTDDSISVRMGDGTYSDTLTVYKVYDGDKGIDAPIAFLTNESITFAADANGQIAKTTVYCNIVAYQGTTKITPTIGTITGIPDGMTITSSETDQNEIKLTIDVNGNSTLGSTSNISKAINIPVITPVNTNLQLSWSKVNSGPKGETGVGISSVTVTYGVSTSASTQPTSWQSSIPTVSEGSYLWTRTITDYTDDAVPDTVTYTYAKQGVKGDTGSTGSSVTVSKIEYQAGTSATVAPTSTWSNSVVSVTEGNYLWSKTTFSDGKIAYGVAKQGTSGRGISKITEYYLATTASSGVTTATDGWTTTVQSVTSTNKYLWNYEVVTYTDGTMSTTTPVIIGVFGNTGATGKGIISVAERYLATASSSGVTTSTSGWTPEIQTLTAIKKYLWNYEIITYTDGTTSTINPVIIGVYGDKGDDGIGINSTTVDYGVSDSATVKPTTWQQDMPVVAEGKYLWTRTIIDYTDTSKADTVTYVYAKQGSKGETGSPGSSVTVKSIKYQAGVSATTAPTGTWSDGVVAVAEGNYLWTQTTFSDNKVAYGVAKQGKKGDKGDKGLDGVTFQVYSATGYIISNETPTLTLQTFAYDGSTEITSGATYQWSQYIDDVWTNISDATTKTLAVTKDDVLKAKSYKCTMTYKSKQYVATVTVQDKTDIYNSIMCVSSNATNNDCYWVLYTLVYSDTKEVDPLLGPISINAPTSPVSGDYWYAVDATNAAVTLKKYNGTSWADSTDKQSLSYYWDIVNDGSATVPLGASSKVKVVSCHDFTATATLICEVSNVTDGLLTQSSLSLTDASDPIVSVDEPIATVNGQIWIKPNNNGTYLMFVWDTTLNNWISSDMDTRNKVYTSRPSSYNVGDLWITASDADHGSYLHGTLLQAQKSNTTYSASDWSPTLRYDQDIDEMKNTLNNLSQYVTITSAGLRIGARSTSGELSPFTSLFTSTELSFYQNSEKLLTLANNQLIAPRIVVEDDLEVQGSISLGDLKIIIENNGSFSFAVQK